MCADQVVEGVPRNRQHGLAVALSVIESIEQMDTAWARSRQTDAETPGVFGISHGGKCCCFLVADLNELDLFLVCAQGLEDAVDAVAGKAEDGIDTPVNEAFY